MAARKVARKKPASASEGRPKKQTRVTPDALTSDEANSEAIESKDASKGGKPKTHAKVVMLMVSIGTEDRNQTHEQFVAALKKKIGAVPPAKNGTRNPGIHVAQTGGYYILDGKVCRPEDYDPKTGTFKKGATPPVWAGGPKNNPTAGAHNQIQYDLDHLSRDEYDKKYRIGKYKIDEEARGQIITPAMQKQRHEQWRIDKQRKEDEALEEFDWDESDVQDDAKLSAASDESVKRAVKKLKSASSKKRVVKKSTPTPKKRTVRRK